ncbi:hypothetical protein CBW65_10360 [Tumebacillus avium]|uniref:Uncharacterized protein n=1 Tax=Tumebacillus avium TaxID=1903704 RepID=A0A1Y0INF5_9BACL|nr:hypothetical protein [Tumebacillus avium]ARU61356.1 hypothetical protein CBW65_10360 [Tumebacillus avium]
MKNVKKAIFGAVAALSLLAAPSNALAAENGSWDPIGTYDMGASGSFNILNVYSGGGDVKFCVTSTSQAVYFKLQTPDKRLLYHDEFSNNCSIFRGVGGAGYYQLIHRYAGQPAVTVSYFD